MRSLAAASLGRPIAGGLVVAALITSVSWQVVGAARDAINTAPPESLSIDLEPLVDQLRERGAGLGRVEVVPTASHREAAALAPYVNLARGWNRQADAARNRLFYRDRPLTPEAYQRWLRRWAVRFVVLSTANPDAAAVEEAALVSGGLRYLDQVWSDDDWTLYEVRRPRPLVSSPATVLGFDAADDHPLHARARPDRRPGRPTRGGWAWSIRWARRCPPTSPTARRRPVPRSCLSGLASDPAVDNPPHNWLVLHATEPGVYRIGAPYKVPRGSACLLTGCQPSPGRPTLQPVDLGPKSVVLALEGQHRLDAGQVET